MTKTKQTIKDLTPACAKPMLGNGYFFTTKFNYKN